MNTPPRKQIESGLYAPVWREFNKLIDYVREISITGGRNVRVNRSLNGTTLAGEPVRQEAPPAAGKVEQFRFKSMNDDTITCVRWDGTTEGEQVTVYKPYKLRRTPWHAQTITIITERIPATFQVTYTYASSNTKRTATSTQVGTETQYIIPRYQVNDLIYATICDELGGDYIDLNVDARAWSEHE